MHIHLLYYRALMGELLKPCIQGLWYIKEGCV